MAELDELLEYMGEGEVVYVLLPSRRYRQSLAPILKNLANKYAKIGVTLFNTPTNKALNLLTAQEEVEEKGLFTETKSKEGFSREEVADRFFFIDCVSSGLKKPQQTRCIHLSPQTGLMGMCGELIKLVSEKKCEVILIDSPINLLEYHDRMEVVRFIHDLTTQLIEANLPCLFIYPTEGFAREIEKDVEMFADKIIETKK
ncbi:MAG: hypothetical protein GF334_11650 [Candidatus Altiarchaeales archaeon]|nr:hypothetical protein [Candidatus Altiarchaeales archaeon]